MEPIVTNERLLRALAEELKVPLLQISREAERSRVIDDAPQPLIERTATIALRLIDSFALSLSSEQELDLEPLTLSSILYDSAQELLSTARYYNTELTVDIPQKYGPIMAKREHLSAAFTILGYQALTQSDVSDEIRPIVTLGAHRSSRGIVAGVFSNNASFAADTFRRALAFGGTARQAYPNASHTNGANLLIADALLRSLASPLKSSRHQKQRGLAATFLPSAQLILV